MTQSEKLQKVIEKAVKNRYQFQGLDTTELILTALITRYQNDISIMVFSHDFAKAFWGEDLVVQGDCGHIYKEDEYHTCEENDNDPPMFTTVDRAWKLNIQQLALTPEEQRTNYLHSFL